MATTDKDQAAKDRTATKRWRQKAMLGPLVAYPLCLTAYLYQSQGEFKFWHGHPLLMTVAYVTLMGNAVTMKKVGGVANTAYHGYLMFAASVAAVAGSTIMWQNKENMKKEHLQTVHSLIGAGVLLNVVYPLAAWVLYNPYNGWKSKPMGNIWRTVHRYTGYTLIVFAFLAMGTGVLAVTKPQSVAQIGFLGGLVAILAGLFLG